METLTLAPVLDELLARIESSDGWPDLELKALPDVTPDFPVVVGTMVGGAL